MKVSCWKDKADDNVCDAIITVTDNDKTWTFEKGALRSGGNAYFADYDCTIPIVKKGPWSIRKWPKEFPNDKKKEVLKAINLTLPQGCCGACLE